MPRDDDKEDDAEEDDDAKGQWCKVLTMEGCFLFLFFKKLKTI